MRPIKILYEEIYIKSLNTGDNRDPRYRYGASTITRRDKYRECLR